MAGSIRHRGRRRIFNRRGILNMTCALDPENPIDALSERLKLYPGGIEAVALRRRISPSLLYSKLRHNNPRENLWFSEFDTFQDWVAAARVPDPYAPLRALNNRHDHIAIHLPNLGEMTEGALAGAMITVVREVGDVAAELEKGMQSGNGLDPEEFAKFKRQVREAVAAMFALEKRAEFATFGPGGEP